MENQEGVVITTTNKKKKGKRKFIAVIILAVALMAIGVGVFFSYMGSPKKIMADAVDKLSGELESIFQENKEEESYTTHSDVNLAVESDYISYLASLDPTYQPFLALLQNISQLDTDVTITQDVEQEQFLATVRSNLNGTNLLDIRYLIQDNQAYYFIQNFLSTYIHLGENNYFADLNQTGEAEDQKYLAEFLLESFKRNLKNSYFIKQQAETELDGKNQEATKITLVLDDHNMSELASNILKDLQADERSSEILSAYDSEFADLSIDVVESTDIEEAITISIYTTSWNYEARKYEVAYSYDGEESFRISYELQENRGVLQLDLAGEVITATIVETNEGTTITYYDQNDNQIGVMEFTNHGAMSSLTYQYESDGVGLLIDFHSEQANSTTNTTLQFQMTAEGISIIDIQADITTEQTDAEEIMADVSGAISEEDITEEQQQQLNQIFANFFLALMGYQGGTNI